MTSPGIGLQRMLLALGLALIVALSEGALYVIWQSRRDRSVARRKRRVYLSAVRHKKDDHDHDRDEGKKEEHALGDAKGRDDAQAAHPLRLRTRPVETLAGE